MKRSLILVGIALAILGWYAPWVTSTRQVAALTYNALDLAEFCKFMVRAGIGSITREWFLVPIVAAALALGLWANPPGQVSRWLRYALTGLAAIFSLVPLPPFMSGMSPFSYLMLMAYRSVEDRGSFWLSVVGLLGVALIFVLGRHLAGRRRDIAFVALALVGAVPALWEFFTRAQPSISEVYGSPAVVSWGFVAMIIGFVVLVMGAVMRENGVRNT